MRSMVPFLLDLRCYARNGLVLFLAGLLFLLGGGVAFANNTYTVTRYLGIGLHEQAQVAVYQPRFGEITVSAVALKKTNTTTPECAPLTISQEADWGNTVYKKSYSNTTAPYYRYKVTCTWRGTSRNPVPAYDAIEVVYSVPWYKENAANTAELPGNFSFALDHAISPWDTYYLFRTESKRNVNYIPLYNLPNYGTSLEDERFEVSLISPPVSSDGVVKIPEGGSLQIRGKVDIDIPMYGGIYSDCLPDSQESSVIINSSHPDVYSIFSDLNLSYTKGVGRRTLEFEKTVTSAEIHNALRRFGTPIDVPFAVRLTAHLNGIDSVPGCQKTIASFSVERSTLEAELDVFAYEIDADGTKTPLEATTTLSGDSAGSAKTRDNATDDFNKTQIHTSNRCPGSADLCASWVNIILDPGDNPTARISLTVSPQGYNPISAVADLGPKEIYGPTKVEYCWDTETKGRRNCNSSDPTIEDWDDVEDEPALDDDEEAVPPALPHCVPPEILSSGWAYIFRTIIDAGCALADVAVEGTFLLLDVSVPLLTQNDDNQMVLVKRPMFENTPVKLQLQNSATTSVITGAGGAVTDRIKNTWTPEAVFFLWQTSFAIARAFFILGIVIYAFMIMFRRDVNKYSLKQFIVNALIGVTLAFFSYQISTLMIDLTRITALFIRDGLFSVNAGIQQTTFTEWSWGIWDYLQTGGVFAGLYFAIGLSGIATTSAATLIPCAGCLISYVMTLVGLVVILLVRVFLIYILVIISPIVFMLGIIPEFASMRSAWFGAMFKILSIYPLGVLIYNLLIIVGLGFSS